MENESNGPSHHHAQDGLPSVPLAVDKHQAHILEVTHGPSEELHQRVRQAIAGQHFYCVLFDCGYAPVESL